MDRPTDPTQPPHETSTASGVPTVALEPDPALPGSDPVDPVAARLLPEPVCRHFRMLPIGSGGDRLTLAMADPGDGMARSVAVALTNDPIEIVAAAPEQVDRAIERIHGELDRQQPREEAALGEEELAASLADRLRIPMLDLEGIEPSAEALELIPEVLRRERHLVPLEVDDTALHVATADPLDEEAYEAIRELTKLQIRPYIVTRAQLEALIAETGHGGRAASRWQRAYAAVLLILLLASFVVAPLQTGIVLVAASAAIYLPAAAQRAVARRGR